MFTVPLLLTIYAGFTHAFEADHLLAVSNIVSQRSNIKLSLKDGIFWGLGHASAIFFIGILMIVLKAGITEKSFHYFEATVGLMLIILAAYRLIKFFFSKKIQGHLHPHINNGETHQHINIGTKNNYKHAHALSYGVGLVHGLAGSGALVVIVLSQMKGTVDGLTYLIIFGMGCSMGMMLASGLFSIPFSKKIMQANSLQSFLIVGSSLLCLFYGSKVIYENIIL